MQTVAARTCVGLPSLQLSRRGPKSSMGPRGPPQLQRTWTLRTNRGGTSSSTSAALPLPFMEISVSVFDTLDLLRSSIEEEVVFQATLQVPAHHAMACRIEAYSTPFAAAPALRSPDLQAAASLTEEDQQFAACLASPPDMEEAHEVRLTRPGAEAASFLQRSAPSLRFASGLLSVSFSLKQRSSSVGGEADPTDPEGGGQACDPHDDSCAVQDILQGRGQGVQGAGAPSTPPGAATTLAALRQNQPATAPLQPAGTHVLHRGAAAAAAAAAGSASAAAADMGSAASHGGPQQHARSRLGVYSAIREDEAEAAPTAAAADRVGGPTNSRDHNNNNNNSSSSGLERPAGLLRVQSITSRGRQSSEVPLTTQLANKGVSTLLGIGFLMLHALETRTAPARQYMQYQCHGSLSFTGRSPSAAAAAAAAAAASSPKYAKAGV